MPQDKQMKKECPICSGEGREVVGEYRVTHDMAVDAGEPLMEGQFHSYEYDTCSNCDGTGLVD